METANLPLLGELETLLLEHLWEAGEADVKAVHLAVGRPRGITLNTVQSTLKRLHEKGLLLRRKVGHAFLYAPGVSRDAYGRRMLDGVLVGVMQGRTDVMLSAFVDLTERAGEDQLRRLERLVEQRLRERRGRDA